MTANKPNFSLVKGGPFHELLSRSRVLSSEGLPTMTAAVLLALFAWGIPALLSVADFLFNDNQTALSYFVDYTAYIRFLLAIGMLVWMERSAHFRLKPIVDQFVDAKLIREESMERYQEVLETADKRSSSGIAELILLVLIYAIAIYAERLDLELGGFDWDGQVVDGRPAYSIAGWWSHWISKPLFIFLVLRWFWRFGVWSWLLMQISRMRLRLIAYHPDKSGGLGFLSVYPMVFSGLIFALSSVVAAQLVSEVHHSGLNYETLQLIMPAWIVFVVIVFVGPLTIFVIPLYRLREQSIFKLGKMASEHQAAFEEKWIAGEATGFDLLGSADVSSASDLAPIAASPYSLKILPVTITVAIYLALTAGTPMLAVVATQMPLQEFLGYVFSTIM